MSVAMEDGSRRHRITFDEYLRMGEEGLIAPDARTELIEGEIIEMPPIGLPHAIVVNRLNRRLIGAVGERAIVQCQGPVRLGDYSDPQPDFAVFASRVDSFQHGRPTAADVHLLIEVSDTSLRYDIRTKKKLYARYGVVEFWVVDVGDARLHVFRNPEGEDYEESRELSSPGLVAIRALDGVEIDMSRLFE